MDIQKEREAFEKLWTDGNGHFKFFKFDQDDCKYRLNGVTDNLSKEDLLLASITLNADWLFWLGAKKRAVPEGFVLVPEDQAKDTDRLNFLLGGEKYIRTVTHRDIQNDEYEKIGEHFQLTEVFWIDGFDYWENTSSNSERGAIDKAMIEAQEPKR